MKKFLYCFFLLSLMQPLFGQNNPPRDAFYIAKNLKIWEELLIGKNGKQRIEPRFLSSLLENKEHEKTIDKIIKYSDCQKNDLNITKQEFIALNKAYKELVSPNGKIDDMQKSNDVKIIKITNDLESIDAWLAGVKGDYIYLKALETNRYWYFWGNIEEYEKIIVVNDTVELEIDQIKFKPYNTVLLDSITLTPAIQDSIDAGKLSIHRAILKEKLKPKIKDELNKEKTKLEKLNQDITNIQKNNKNQEFLSAEDKTKLFGTFNNTAIEGAAFSPIIALSSMEIPQFKLPSQSEMIDAFAILIANRFKEEVALTFVDKLRNTLANDELLSIIFPESSKMFESVALYVNPSFGASWKEAFALDFVHIQENIKKYLEMQCSSDKSSKVIFNKELGCHYVTIITMIEDLRGGISFIEVVDAQVKRIEPTDTTASAKLLQMIDLFNKNLRNFSNDQYFASYQDFINMKEENLIGYTYFVKELNRGLQIIFKSDNVVQLDDKRLYSIILNYQRLEQILRSLNNSSNSQNGLSNLNTYWSCIESIVDDLIGLFPSEDKQIKERIKKVKNIIHYSIEIQKSLEQKNYGLMVNHLMGLLNNLINEQANSGKTDFEILLEKKYRNSNWWEDEYYAFKKIDSTEFKKITPYSSFTEFHATYYNYKQLKYFLTSVYSCETSSYNIIQDFIKEFSQKKISHHHLSYYIYQKLYELEKEDLRFYKANQQIILDKTLNTLNFIVDILTIQDSKELSKLITSRAAPVSSYKIKRNNRFSIDFNAYPMIYFGQETPKLNLFGDNQNTNGVYRDSAAWVNGFSCPIGISFSLGTHFRKNSKTKFSKTNSYMSRQGSYRLLKGNSTTFTISVIDLGAAVSYRISKGEDGELPKSLRFEQFLAPGLFISRGIKRTPLALMLGAQFTPKLRSFAMEEKPFGALRFSLGLVMDIPLYNVHHFTKRQTKIYSTL